MSHLRRAFFAGLPIGATATPPPLFEYGPPISYTSAMLMQPGRPIQLPPPTGLFLGTSSYTFEFWAQATGAGAVGYIQTIEDGTNRFLSLLPLGGTLYFDSGNDGAGRLTGGWPNHFPNRLIHYALQVDTVANKMRLYVDGGLFAEKDGYALRYGIENSLDFVATEVRFGEVRYWNYVRTQAQIQADMNLSMGGPQPGLLGCWRMDTRGPVGTLVFDRSGHNHHGKLT